MAEGLSEEAIERVLEAHSGYGEDIRFWDADGREWVQPTCQCTYPLGEHLSLVAHQSSMVMALVRESTVEQSGALSKHNGKVHPGLWADYIGKGLGEPMVRRVTMWEKDSRDPSERQYIEDWNLINKAPEEEPPTEPAKTKE